MELDLPSGHYATHALISSDGKSSTFLASRAGDPKKYQLKITPKTDKSGVSRVGEGMLEARILKNIDNPLIIKYVDELETEENIILVTEFFSSETLQKRIQTYGPMQEKSVHDIAAQIVSAIEFLQGLGISYSNFSPSSFQIGLENRVKLSDFSCARQIGDPIPRIICPLPPPEIITQAKPETAFSEVFSIGVLIYYLLSMGHPWTATYDDDLLREINNRPLQKKDFMSQECFFFLQGMLEPSVGRRYSIHQALSHYWLSQNTKRMERPISRVLFQQKSVALSSIPMKRHSMIYRNSLTVEVPKPMNGSISLSQIEGRSPPSEHNMRPPEKGAPLSPGVTHLPSLFGPQAPKI